MHTYQNLCSSYGVDTWNHRLLYSGISGVEEAKNAEQLGLYRMPDDPKGMIPQPL